MLALATQVIFPKIQRAGMSEEMFDEGFTYQINIDISTVVTKAMQEKYKDKGPNFKFTVMDIMSSEFDNGEFDAVVDKGTLDCILVIFLGFKVKIFGSAGIMLRLTRLRPLERCIGF